MAILKIKFLKMLIVLLAISGMSVYAATVAHWDFEDGVPGQAFDPDGGGDSGSYSIEGNNYLMRGWDNYWGAYFSQIGETPSGSGLGARLADNHQDGYVTDTALTTWSPTTWTIETSIRLESTSGWLTFIGRDGSSQSEAESDFYLQKNNINQRFRINFDTVGGQRYILDSNDNDSNLIPEAGKWYHIAVTSDGSKLKMYVDSLDANGFELVASLDMNTLNNNALAQGGYNWTFGRGWYGGSHTDRTDSYMDNVRFSDAALDPSKFLKALDYTRAHDPDPQPNAEDVGMVTGTTVNIDLKWKAGLNPNDMNQANPNITNHRLYVDTCDVNLGFGKSNLIEVNVPPGGPPPVNDVNYLATGLTYSTTYHWRVDEIISGAHPNDPDPNKVITGYVWLFETISQEPTITAQPSDALRDVNETAVFTVGVSSATTVNYQWYKSDDGIADKGSPDVTIGSDSNTLTIVANEANDAYYYVVAQNAAGQTYAKTSEVVHLWLKREIGRWKLDNNLNDSSAAAKGGTAVRDYVSGSHNSPNAVFDPCDPNGDTGNYSMLFKDDPNAFLSVVDTNYFNCYVVGLTASCWVKIDGAPQQYKPIIAKQSRTSIGYDGTNNFSQDGWVLESNSGAPFFSVRDASTDLTSGTAIDDGNWHMVTAVFNPPTFARLYVDGQLDVEDTEVTSGAIKAVDRFTMANEDSNDGSMFGGSFGGYIDDVRIFTYPMTSKQVAEMYFDTLPGADPFCIDSNEPDYDLNGDCVVDLEDIAELADDWFDCNLYPTCF